MTLIKIFNFTIEVINRKKRDLVTLIWDINVTLFLILLIMFGIALGCVIADILFP